MNREFIVSIAGKPLRALRSGRFPLSPMVARISPRTGAMMDSYRLEEQGQFGEALAVWKTLKGTQTSRASAYTYGLRVAKLALKAGMLAEAVKEYRVLRALDPNDQRAVRGLESATMRAARSAQTLGHWLEAARMWSAFGEVSADKRKAVRNLTECARYVAQSANTAEKMNDALETWGLLKALDPDLREARQGMVWCRLSLARTAERAKDWTAARQHWNAMLQISPGDPRALDGLRRADAAST